MASPTLLLYRLLIHGALPLLLPALWVKDRLTGKTRPSLAQRLARSLPDHAAGGLLIQAVSVGEVELARRLLAELQQRVPELPLLLTTTTATGLALARSTLTGQLPIHPCPLDLPGPVGRLLDASRPRALVLVETELWPELLHQAARRQVPAAVINARLSEGSYARYRRIRSLLGSLLAPVSLVLARSPADAAHFADIGIPEQRIRVTGNIKYDLQPDPQPLPWQEEVQALAGGRAIVVAGSTMPGEEEILLEALAALPEATRAGLLTILAPRHPERFAGVASLLEERGCAFVRRSALSSGRTGAPDQSPDHRGDAPERSPELLLLDSIGELGRAYRLASAAFIGGSLVPTGGHNPLEPAVWGVPVLSGLHVFNFREVYDELVAGGGARLVSSAAELSAALAAWLDDRQAARRAGDAALAVVERNRGATARTADALLALAGLAPA